MICSRENSILVVVDLQDSFLAPIEARKEILARSRFIVEIAHLLGVPILATEQYASRMGGTHADLSEAIGASVPRIDKLCFSCMGASQFEEALLASGKRQVVLVGIESHICITQTALDLRTAGYDLFLCADALGARSKEAHEIALKRLQSEGCKLTHTESVCYEWLRTAEAAEFRDALAIVKRNPI